MTRTRSFWLVAVLIASTVLTATVAQAQPSTRGDRMYSRMQQNLGLTDDQVTAIRQIHQGQRDARRQLWQSLHQAQTDVRQLALSGGDAAALAAKKTQVEQLLAQGLDLRVQALQQIGPLLTAEQRDKLAQMGPRAMMWRGRHGHHAPKAPQS
jgi:Spy/CpxP family protein refolding chaperone